MITTSGYPKYKDSGVEWLGTVPHGWEVAPFKKLFRASDERVEDSPKLNLALSISGYRGVEPRNIDSMEGQMPSEDINKYRIVRKGQLAVNTMWLNYAGLGVSDLDGYVSPAYRAYDISPAIDKKFAHHLLRSPRYIQKYSSLLYGLRPNSLQVKSNDFEKIEILLPPLETQKKIAAFLDEKTQTIDALIEKKEKLITLLREQRQSLITRTVTKGLDPKAKMKDSGIEWAGTVPEHWEIKKLKFVAAVQASNVDKNSYEGEERVFLCNYVDVYKNEFITSNLEFMSASATKNQKRKLSLKAGDLAITKDSEEPSDIGVPALVIEDIPDLVCGYHLYHIRPVKGLNGKFLLRYIQADTTKGYFETRSNGITRYGLGSYSVMNFLIPIPPSNEQGEIVHFLDTAAEKIDRGALLTKQQILKLKEYRSSLIYSAVTGKIKI